MVIKLLKIKFKWVS